MIKRIVSVLAVVAALSFPTVAAAATPASQTMDSGGCVTRGEYDALDWGLSTDQVRNRFDTNGWLIGTGTDFFRRGYNACWTSDRIVVIWYDFNLGLSDHWDVR